MLKLCFGTVGNGFYCNENTNSVNILFKSKSIN